MSDPIVTKEAEVDVVAEIEAASVADADADADVDVDVDVDASPVLRNQIKVTAVGRIYKYVTYARDLLSKSPNEIVIRAMGGAVSNAITVANLLRRGVLGLAQVTVVSRCDRLSFSCLLPPVSSNPDLTPTKKKKKKTLAR